jgi:hypothetical protein
MEYVFDKDFWKELPGGMPYVKRIKEGDSK